MLYGLPGDAADHFSSIVTLSSLPLDLNGTPLSGFTALANSSPRFETQGDWFVQREFALPGVGHVDATGCR
jgi:hypothetical protein